MLYKSLKRKWYYSKYGNFHRKIPLSVSYYKEAIIFNTVRYQVYLATLSDFQHYFSTLQLYSTRKTLLFWNAAMNT